MKRTNYSYETSLPPYHENHVGKEFQANMIYSIILQTGRTCLKQLEKITGLPQSTISARCNDLIKLKKVEYSDKAVMEGRLRKIITAVEAA